MEIIDEKENASCDDNYDHILDTSFGGGRIVLLYFVCTLGWSAVNGIFQIPVCKYRNDVLAVRLVHTVDDKYDPLGHKRSKYDNTIEAYQKGLEKIREKDGKEKIEVCSEI